MYWGLSDSTIKFCEPDYETNIYIAEYYNTISAFFYIIIGIFVIRIDKNIAFSLFLLGITTGIFHMTMRKYGQVADEISMLILVFRIFQRIKKISIYYLYLILSIYTISNDYFIIFMLGFTGLLFYLYYNVLVLNKYKYTIQKLNNVRTSFYLIMAASICWIIDICFCNYITILNFHSIWHILTALVIWYAIK